MDNNKGINGSGLAHVMNRARSEFAQKKIVTEVVPELNSRYNYTGVVAKPLTATGFEWRKTADTLYSVDDLAGKTAIKEHFNGAIVGEQEITHDSISVIGENGSFFMDTYFVCVRPEDVGEKLNVGTEVIFPEAGIYLFYGDYQHNAAYCIINIVGTYKREFYSNDQTYEVFGRIDPETFQVTYLDFTFDAITEAMILGQFIRLRCWIPDKTDDEIGRQLFFPLETYSTDFGFFEFGDIIDADLGEGKQLYYYKVTLSEDNTISTERKVLSGGGSDEEDDVFQMHMFLPFGSLQANWPKGNNSRNLKYQDIVDAFESDRQIQTTIFWEENGDEQLPCLHQTTQTTFCENYDDDTSQIIISAILNIDVQDGSGKQDYYFKFILNEDETVTTEYPRVGGGSGGEGGSEPVQEIFYADFDVDLSDFTVTGMSTTYQEMVSQIDAGKYIVGRGIYAMVSSPINMAYFPLSTDVREGGALIFSGLLRSSFANQDVILSITVTIDSSNQVYVQARLVSTTDIK